MRPHTVSIETGHTLSPGRRRSKIDSESPYRGALYRKQGIGTETIRENHPIKKQSDPVGKGINAGISHQRRIPFPTMGQLETAPGLSVAHDTLRDCGIPTFPGENYL